MAGAELELRRRRTAKDAIKLTPIIAPETTFLQWCEELQQKGLKVDDKPFSLSDRPAMRWIYSLMPSTIEEAFKTMLVLMKCSQVGFTVLEILYAVYVGLKWMPCKVGFYLPSRDLAAIKSADRFMPVVRTIPEAYAKLTESSINGGEGNVLIRNMGSSRFHFMWTTSKTATESIPLDLVLFDEVQEMVIGDMEKTQERMSASSIRFTLMGSTANMPDMDIDFWFKRGAQYQFHTWCPSCETEHVLDERFPDCIQYDEELRDYLYVCACGAWIDDPQRHNPAREHGWLPKNPEARFISIHFPQILSPTISPREMIEAYFNAEDIKNFWNRKLGKPFIDEDKVPVTMELLKACAAEGSRLGILWKKESKECFMAIDQMGKFNVVIVAERLQTGHMAFVHVEAIYADDPFVRCDEIMAAYNVSVCVVEQLPNYNDAHRFAKRHEGRVFLVNYGTMSDNWILWGDAVQTKGERKIEDADRLKYTVTINQYRAMSMALEKIKKKICVFPDPNGLVQEVIEKGIKKVIPILKEMVFLHLTKVGLVVDQDPEEKKMRARVVKIGIDPHFAYAFMMLNVAWARAHGTTSFIMPDNKPTPLRKDLPGLPSGVVSAIESSPEGTCGRCTAFENGKCMERNLMVKFTDPGCSLFVEM